MLAREIHSLCDLGFSDFVSKHTTHTDTALMHLKHYICRLLMRLVEETLQHMDDEFHRRVVIVQH